jgi:hypothetical protein
VLSLIIDSNQPENVDFISVPKYSINDHYPICISHKRELKNKKQFHDHITDRSMKMFKESDFNEHLSKCSFTTYNYTYLFSYDKNHVSLYFL